VNLDIGSLSPKPESLSLANLRCGPHLRISAASVFASLSHLTSPSHSLKNIWTPLRCRIALIRSRELRRGAPFRSSTWGVPGLTDACRRRDGLCPVAGGRRPVECGGMAGATRRPSTWSAPPPPPSTANPVWMVACGRPAGRLNRRAVLSRFDHLLKLAAIPA